MSKPSKTIGYKARQNAMHVQHYLEQAVNFHRQGEFMQAQTLYRQVLSKEPDNFDALHLAGVIAAQTGHNSKAVELISKAININPNSADAYYNLGNALQCINHPAAAVDSYQKALVLYPDNIDAICNLALAYTDIKDYSAALSTYQRALSLNPNYDNLYANYLFTKLSICDWQNLDNELAELSTHIAASLQTARPFSLLGLIDDPALQRQAAENWTQSKDPQNPALGNIGKYPAHSKIRIGYFSADFRNHAVSYLCAELFEKHDRNRFEIIAFSLADPQIKDSMRLRLEAGFDQFIDLHTHSDLQVAQLARKMQIDIAVDLSGHTRGGRPGIFALRAAPLQVSYIGYLGTMGAEYMDYLLADPVIIPKANRKYYTENILYLPSYQVNDTQRQIAEKTFTRQQLGLPEQGFVFCCFNNNYKISPATFRCWMQILNKVTDSVLLIFSECEQVMQHLKAAASQQSIDPQRLVFAERLPLPDYLSRYRQADLFLDTWPYNAGTTGSDALWAGLPLLTCPGAAFPSRIAASLLTAIGLEELIAANQDEYVKLAIEMANQPEKLATIRQKLAVNRLTSPLFDINGFCKHIEAGYTQIYQRYRDGLAATDIWINKQAL